MTTRKGPARPDVNEVLAEITGALVGHFKMSSLLDQVVETSMSTLNAEVCAIFLKDKKSDPEVLVMMAGSGFARNLAGKAKYQIGEGFTGTIAKYGKGFNIKSREELEHLEVDGVRVWRGKHDHDQWPSGQSEFKNCISLPLLIKDQILGVIKVENKYPSFGEFFTEDDERYFEIIANVVALAVENARLHEQIEKQLKTIAAKAAHRINNQLTNYDGIEIELTEQVQSAIPDKQQLERTTIRIADTTKEIKRMVGEFRSYGRPITVEKKLCDINKLIKDETWLAKPPSNIEIINNLGVKLPLVAVDEFRFAEAVKELLRNSIKAMAQNPNQERGEIVVSTSLLGSRLVLEICDNGPGFPSDFSMFEPFNSTDPQSTGLGLATVKELVEAHGGEIAALKPERGGAHIVIKVPM